MLPTGTTLCLHPKTVKAAAVAAARGMAPRTILSFFPQLPATIITVAHSLPADTVLFLDPNIPELTAMAVALAIHNGTALRLHPDTPVATAVAAAHASLAGTYFLLHPDTPLATTVAVSRALPVGTIFRLPKQITLETAISLYSNPCKTTIRLHPETPVEMVTAIRTARFILASGHRVERSPQTAGSTVGRDAFFTQVNKQSGTVDSHPAKRQRCAAPVFA